MRILFLSNDFPSPWFPTKGTFNFELARELGRENEVRVVAPIPWLDELRAISSNSSVVVRNRAETRDGITIDYPRYYYTPKFGRRWYGRLLWQSLKKTLQATTRDFRPEAVIGYWAHPDGTVAVKYARQIGAAAFVMVGGSDVLVQARVSPCRRRLISETLRSADGVFAVSDDIRQRVIEFGIPGDRVHVAYRGVDRDHFSPEEKSAARARLGIVHKLPMFLWVGRMEPVKGLDVLLRAAGKLRERECAFELVLAGDGSERNRIERNVSALGLDGRVRLVGPVLHTNLPDWFRAADWTVLSSRSEGVPNVLLESHASGTPFIATRVGGVAEIAIEGVDRLVAPGDLAAFAEQMLQALTAPRVNPEDLTAHVTSLDSAANFIGEMIGRVVETRKNLVSQRAAAAIGTPTLTIPKMSCIAAQSVWPGRARSESQPNPLRQLIRGTMEILLPRRFFLAGGPRRSGQVCLTFDDGPHPEHTPRLLDVLAELGMKATFFVIGREAERFPHIVRRIADEGHEIGNHSWSHYESNTIAPADFVTELQRTSQVLAELIGRSCSLFRPPHGKLTTRQLVNAWRFGQTVVLWNHDPKDYACHSARDVTRFFAARPPRGGSIVLLHDNHPHTIDALPAIVAGIRAHNLTFAALDGWLSVGHPLSCTQIR